MQQRFPSSYGEWLAKPTTTADNDKVHDNEEASTFKVNGAVPSSVYTNVIDDSIVYVLARFFVCFAPHLIDCTNRLEYDLHHTTIQASSLGVSYNTGMTMKSFHRCFPFQ
jgi:hypothetical protein